MTEPGSEVQEKEKDAAAAADVALSEYNELSDIRSKIMASSDFSERVHCTLLSGSGSGENNSDSVLSVSPLEWHPELPPDRALARINVKFVDNYEL